MCAIQLVDELDADENLTELSWCSPVCRSGGYTLCKVVLPLSQIVDNTYRLGHLLVQVIALTCSLTNTSKHRETTCMTSLNFSDNCHTVQPLM